MNDPLPNSNPQPNPNPVNPQPAPPAPNVSPNPQPQPETPLPTQTPQSQQTQSSIPPQPQVSPTDPPQPKIDPNQKLDKPKDNKPKKFNLLAVILVIVFLIISSTAGLAYAVSYQKLSLGVPELEKKISHAVMSIPFTPKTSTYIVEKATEVQKDMSKYSFNASMSLKSEDFRQLLQTNEFNMEFVGKLDFSDLENAKMEFNSNITKYINFDFKTLDNNIYFKINKLPDLLFAFLGMEPDTLNPIMNEWVSYDFSSLETEASQYMDDNKPSTPSDYYTQEKLEEWFDFLTSEDFQKNITLSEEEIFGKKAHRLNIKVNKDLLNKIAEKEKEIYGDDYSADTSSTENWDKIFKNFVVDIWIEKDTYLLRKIASNITANPDTKGLNSLSTDVLGAKTSKKVLGDNTYQSNPEISMAFVVTFDDIGQDVNIEVPNQTTPLEEYVLKLQKILNSVEEEKELEMYNQKLEEEQELLLESSPSALPMPKQ